MNPKRDRWVVSFLLCTGLTLGLYGCPSCIPEGLWPSDSASPSPSPSPDPVAATQSTANANISSEPLPISPSVAKENSEILSEVLHVVFMRKPENLQEFSGWANTLNQGASLEGVYNGLTHAANYRHLEESNPGASPAALRMFSEELAYLEAELPSPTPFDASHALPLAVLGQADMLSASHPSGEASPSPVPSKNPASIAPWAEDYAKIFSASSIFTLKRVLGDEALKVISVKNLSKDKLAFWFSKWVVRLAQRSVDFGLDQRNKPDDAFHYQWALENSEDRIRWEVLNRLHRVLNAANLQKEKAK